MAGTYVSGLRRARPASAGYRPPNRNGGRIILHIVLHVAVPVLVARLFFPCRWWRVAVLLTATMVVDIDHLLADPIYDPDRCSLGFHPLHTTPALGAYAALLGVPVALRRVTVDSRTRSLLAGASLVGLGLLLHMALDWTDCLG